MRHFNVTNQNINILMQEISCFFISPNRPQNWLIIDVANKNNINFINETRWKVLI